MNERDAETAFEIKSTRVFNVPREDVFEAWTDPGQLAIWWGPAGFTNTFETFDLRADGEWRFVMHGPDGTNYPNLSVFRDIVRPARIVFDHISAPAFHVIVTFDDLDGRTRLTWRMIFDAEQTFQSLKTFVAAKNEENLDRLEAFLAGR